MHHPYFLIFGAGIAFGLGMSCAVLSLLPRRRTVSVRRRCRIVVPISLIVTVVGAGTGYINTLPGRGPAGGAIVFTVSALVTIGTVILPRWWRFAVLLPPVLVLAGAVPLWVPYPGRYLDPQVTTTVAVTDDTDDSSDSGDDNGTIVPVALMHIRPVSGEDLLEISAAPVGDLLPRQPDTGGTAAGSSPENGSDGDPRDDTAPPGGTVTPMNLWATPLRVPFDHTVDITLTVLRYPPELWWFPPEGLPVTLTLSVDEDSRVFERYPATALSARTFAVLASIGAVTTEHLHLELPGEATTYLQPGVYVIGAGRTPQIIRRIRR